MEKNIEEVKLHAGNAPGKLTLNRGWKLEFLELEENIYHWVLSQQEEKLAASTLEIVDKALSIDSTVRNGDASKLKNWVYEFLKRRNQSIIFGFVKARS